MIRPERISRPEPERETGSHMWISSLKNKEIDLDKIKQLTASRREFATRYDVITFSTGTWPLCLDWTTICVGAFGLLMDFVFYQIRTIIFFVCSICRTDCWLVDLIKLNRKWNQSCKYRKANRFTISAGGLWWIRWIRRHAVSSPPPKVNQSTSLMPLPENYVLLIELL